MNRFASTVGAPSTAWEAVPITDIATLDAILNAHATELAGDFVAYRNHTYRVANRCLVLSPHGPGHMRRSVRQRLRQPEPAEHAAIKTDHGADPIAGEGEDEEAGSVADAAGGSAKVGSERRLPIRACRHEVVRSAAHETGEEARHDVAAVVLEGNWRHRDADIDGE